MIGTEAERIAVVREDGSPLPYAGSVSVVAVFDWLIAEHGWEPERERAGGPVIALRREGASVTLEPGSQIELSGAPFASVIAGQQESDALWQSLMPIMEELGLVWLGLGCHPFGRVEELGWVPKLRYGVMKDYMPTRGPMAADMMTKTATVQANLDYASESDAMRKLRVSLRAQALVTAMFANSPWAEGVQSGFRSTRSWIWQHMDRDRSGLLPFAWKDRSTYVDYANWALGVPMFLIKRGDQVHANTGQTFRDFMNEGFEGVRATYGDWAIHLSTIFPEVRLKSTLEVRGADAQSPELTFALPALWKGLLYDDESLSKLEGLVDSWTFDEVEKYREPLARRGVQARYFGRDAVDWAGEILDLAETGLGRLDAGSPTQDVVLLAPLRALLERAQCPADPLLERVPDPRPSKAAVIDATAIRDDEARD